MARLFAISLIFFSSQVLADPCVVLLHGLVRSNSSMQKLAAALDETGFSVVNYDYPSTEHTIEELAEKAIGGALVQCPQEATVNFVTHSLGGILVRQYLSRHAIGKMGRVVMLGPPNKGSEVVDKLHDVPGFELLHGPAGLQLGTDELSLPNRLGPADFEVGIIAGSRSINLILSTMLPSADDGKVSVENTKLEGMSDHITLPVSHAFMMKNREVIRQVIHFLKNGAFDSKA